MKPETTRNLMLFVSFLGYAFLCGSIISSCVEKDSGMPEGFRLIKRGNVTYVLDKEFEVCHAFYGTGGRSLVPYQDCYNMLVESVEKGFKSE